MNDTIPPQPHIMLSYIKVGRLLYASLFLFIFEAWLYWVQLNNAVISASIWLTIGWLLCFLFAFVHIFLVLADGWSRFQNYKRAKDLFFIHGFQVRIANMYIGSKCQRMAATAAADELGLGAEIRKHYIKMSVKWYHFIPYFMIFRPLFIFSEDFWSRTFLERNYQAKFDFKNLKQELAL